MLFFLSSWLFSQIQNGGEGGGRKDGGQAGGGAGFLPSQMVDCMGLPTWV